MNVRDRKILLTILTDIEDIEQAIISFNCKGIEDFLKDRLLQKCVVMSLINISEAIVELSNDFLKENNSVDWKQFKRIRNIAAHKYGAINFVVVWNIINSNLIAFKERIQGLVG